MLTMLLLDRFAVTLIKHVWKKKDRQRFQLLSFQDKKKCVVKSYDSWIRSDTFLSSVKYIEIKKQKQRKFNKKWTWNYNFKRFWFNQKIYFANRRRKKKKKKKNTFNWVISLFILFIKIDKVCVFLSFLRTNVWFGEIFLNWSTIVYDNRLLSFTKQINSILYFVLNKEWINWWHCLSKFIAKNFNSVALIF